jgi:hypothetical protein
MRGRPSVVVRTDKLEVVLARRRVPHRPRYDFSTFADEELEDLAVLAEKIESACGEPAWTADDRAVLTRLEGKLVAAMGARQ